MATSFRRRVARMRLMAIPPFAPGGASWLAGTAPSASRGAERVDGHVRRGRAAGRVAELPPAPVRDRAVVDVGEVRPVPRAGRPGEPASEHLLAGRAKRLAGACSAG